MIKTPIITRDVDGDWVFGRWEFCGDALESLFEVPSTATRLQILAYKRSKKGRTRVTLKQPYAELDDEEHLIMGCTWSRINNLIDGDSTWYIDVYYWEDEE